LAALRLAVGVLWQFSQHADKVWQLESRDTPRKRSSEARGTDWGMCDIAPETDPGGAAVSHHPVRQGEYAGPFKSSPAEDGLLDLTRHNQHTFAFEAVVRATHDEHVTVGIYAREIAG